MDAMTTQTKLHECATDGCEAQVVRDYLMCPGHWAALPRKLRRAINVNWRSPHRSMDRARVLTGKARKWLADKEDA